MRLQDLEQLLSGLGLGIESVRYLAKKSNWESKSLALPANRSLEEDLSLVAKAQAVNRLKAESLVYPSSGQRSPKNGDILSIFSPYRLAGDDGERSAVTIKSIRVVRLRIPTNRTDFDLVYGFQKANMIARGYFD